MVEDLRRAVAAHRKFAVVMDCVSSADPRDQQTIDYPGLFLRDAQNADMLLTDDFIYRRLGGPLVDWIRAGVERTCGITWCWPNRHDKLFWVRFPQSAGELRQLQEWAEAGKLRPHIAATYDFSPEGVHEALEAIRSRRVQGKVVVKILSDDS